MIKKVVKGLAKKVIKKVAGGSYGDQSQKMTGSKTKANRFGLTSINEVKNLFKKRK